MSILIEDLIFGKIQDQSAANHINYWLNSVGFRCMLHDEKIGLIWRRGYDIYYHKPCPQTLLGVEGMAAPAVAGQPLIAEFGDLYETQIRQWIAQYPTAPIKVTQWPSGSGMTVASSPPLTLGRWKPNHQFQDGDQIVESGGLWTAVQVTGPSGPIPPTFGLGTGMSIGSWINERTNGGKLRLRWRYDGFFSATPSGGVHSPAGVYQVGGPTEWANCEVKLDSGATIVHPLAIPAKRDGLGNLICQGRCGQSVPYAEPKADGSFICRGCTIEKDKWS